MMLEDLVDQVHDTLEATTIMRCSSRQLGPDMFGIMVFPASLPDDETEEQVRFMNEEAEDCFPPDMMAAITIRDNHSLTVANRIDGQTAMFIGRVVADAYSDRNITAIVQIGTVVSNGKPNVGTILQMEAN